LKLSYAFTVVSFNVLWCIVYHNSSDERYEYLCRMLTDRISGQVMRSVVSVCFHTFCQLITFDFDSYMCMGHDHTARQGLEAEVIGQGQGFGFQLGYVSKDGNAVSV